MEFLNVLANRYHLDFIRGVLGATFLIFLGYKFQQIIEIKFLLDISAVERILLFVLLSVIVGRMASWIGGAVTSTFSWLFFYKGKIKWFTLEYSRLLEDFSSDFDDWTISFNPNLVLEPAVYDFIGSKATIKAEYESTQSYNMFWTSLVGVLMMCLAVSTTEFEIFGLLIVIGLCIPIGIAARAAANAYWQQCVKSVSFTKNTRKL